MSNWDESQEVGEVIKIIQSDDPKEQLSGIKLLHKYVKNEEQILQFLYNAKTVQLTLNFILSGNQDMVIEVMYFYSKLLELQSDDVSLELVKNNFVSTLYDKVNTTEYDQCMREFHNGLEIQRIYYLLISNMCASPILYIQLMEHRNYVNQLLMQHKQQKSERVIKFLILAQCSVVYFTPEKNNQIDTILVELIQNIPTTKDIDSQFAIIQALYSYNNLDALTFQLDYNLIFQIIELNFVEVQNYQTERLVHECIKILYNYSIDINAENPLYQYEHAVKLVQLIDYCGNNENLINAILLIILNLTSIQEGAQQFYSNKSFIEKLNSYIINKNMELLNSVIQIHQNFLFYELTQYDEDLFVYIVNFTYILLVRNEQDRDLISKLLNLINSYLTVFQMKALQACSDYDFMIFKDHYIVCQIVAKLKKYEQYKQLEEEKQTQQPNEQINMQ